MSHSTADPGRTRPDSYAAMTAWVRLRRPSLPRIRLTWVLIVSSLTTSRSASSAFDRLVIILTVLPLLVGTGLPAGPTEWLMRLTPAGGFALQRVLEPSEELVDPTAMITPLAGLAVLIAYATGALALAGRVLNRRDA